jgi:tetratricopeptide (TPR) repeat protein
MTSPDRPAAASATAPALADITLCLIVKDEAAFLERCLTSVAPACGAVVIVDTGSTDATPEIARAFTPTVLAASMEHGFSAPRNLALDQVETPWVLFLDADERFEPAEVAKLGETLSAADDEVQGMRVLRYNLSATGGFTAERILRLFRHRPDVRYRHIVGESVEDTLAEAGGDVLDAPVILNHFGELRPLAVRDAKAHRYLALLARQAAADPGCGTWPAYRALLLRGLGRFDKALASSERALALAPDDAIVWLCHGHVLRARNQPGPARAAYERGLELAPRDGTLRNMLGVMQLVLGELDAAEATLAQAARDDPLLVHVDVNRGLVAQARGALSEAVTWFERAARRNPALVEQPWAGHVEADPFSPLRSETIPQFRGLGYHLAYCRALCGGAAA